MDACLKASTNSSFAMKNMEPNDLNDLESPNFGTRLLAQLALVVIAACLIVYGFFYLVSSLFGESI